MIPTKPRSLTITLPGRQRVSALLQIPQKARACYVMAHGAGAGMRHAFLAAIADGLAQRGIATLRFQFLYMEKGMKRPDAPEVAHAAIRAAVQKAAQRFPRLPLFAGGRSFGGRMTSQAQALGPLPKVRGLIFLGFPLHPAGKPSSERAEHLAGVQLPMLFLQGTRDELATLPRLRPVCRKLGARATLVLVRDADHSFHVPARTGRRDADVQADLVDAMEKWIDLNGAGAAKAL